MGDQISGTMIFEGLQLSYGVSYMVERGSYGVTERSSEAGSVQGVGNSEPL